MIKTFKRLGEFWVEDIFPFVARRPVLVACIVFLGATVIVVAFTLILTLIISSFGYDLEFLESVLAEAHGMLLDILVISIFIVWLTRRGDKLKETMRYRDEIDDFRRWESEEAAHLIVRNVKRLNDNGVTDIDLSSCYLVKADLGGFDLTGGKLAEAKAGEANLRDTKLVKADLRKADLKGATLTAADLSEAF
ncbi:MAG: pentapeptide repeat-containing protein, partial [Dehalococcoidia bacterium]